MKLNPETMARASSRRPWLTVGLWVVLVIVAGTLSSLFLADALSTDVDFTDEPSSKLGERLLIERLRGEDPFTEFVVVTAESATAFEPAYQAYVDELQSGLQALGAETVVGVGSYLNLTGPVSDDGRTVLLPVLLNTTDIDVAGETAHRIHDVISTTPAPAGTRTVVAGTGSVNNDFQELAEETLRRGEGFGIAIALIVLVVVFGAVVAALLPIVLAIAAIAAAFGAAALLGLVFELSFFITNMITMIGLAVGIDYSLFIVSRYREERARGRDKDEAIGRAGATASRAVFFSGVTVVLALLGMLLVPNTIFRSLGLGAIFVVTFSIAASLTLLPAVLHLMGDRINKWHIGRRRRDLAAEGGMWDKITHAVMARPVVSLVLAAGLLITLSIPYFSIDKGFAGVSTLPEDVESRQAFELLAENFSGGLTSPVEIVVDGTITPEIESRIETLQGALDRDPLFGASTVTTNAAGDLALVEVPFTGDPNSEASVDAIRSLRSDTLPFVFGGTDARVLVTGDTAFAVDFFADVDTFTPIVFVFVLGLSFVLLTVVFRSLVVPIKAIIMNLLSVGAAYGMVVMFFQAGVGPGFVKDLADLSGFIQVEAIEAWLPLFLFSILFGLSMDYHVFLLTRIREHFDLTGDNTGSVAYGLRTTGAIITGAALIMVAVFSGFALGDLVSLQQMGFGLAVAVFLDATVVRSVLVPATMKLLGNRNWYLPAWLQWLPELDVEGHEAAAHRVDAETEVPVG
ncbi:MAG: MMPL family transporter [Acidimicrobiia bacterium]|nr:MMPL family transporter [Acidimicrobiia bacterium]